MAPRNQRGAVTSRHGTDSIKLYSVNLGSSNPCWIGAKGGSRSAEVSRPGLTGPLG